MNIYVIGRLIENYSAVCTYQGDVYIHHGLFGQNLCGIQRVKTLSGILHFSTLAKFSVKLTFLSH